MKDLEEVILSMKNKKALGPDGIPAEIYKLVFCHQLDLHTARCIQCSPEGGSFSCRWKSAKQFSLREEKSTGDADMEVVDIVLRGEAPIADIYV